MRVFFYLLTQTYENMTAPVDAQSVCDSWH